MSVHPIFSPDMQEIVESFVVETREIFETLDNDLLVLETSPKDKSLIDQIFRAVHTVKGTSGFLSLEQLSILAHHFEDVLNKLRREELNFHSSMMDVMFAAFDLMKVLLQQVVEQKMEPIDLSEVISNLNAISDGTFRTEEIHAPAAETPEADVMPVETALPEAETESDQTVAEEEAGPSEVAEVVAAPPVEEAPQAETPAAVADQASAPNMENSAARRKADAATETIRVEVGRLDDLMNLVGELVLSRNRLLQVVSTAGESTSPEELQRELADTSAQVDFITTELQTAIMRTRMVQIGRVFNKFPRIVRDLAKEFNKKIDLIIEGEETELDKSLVEEIGDPLVHLIRNAADHGIEMPEKRLANGKPANGTIRLTAAHEGNNIVIEIEDDGAGIDAARVKQVALEKGVISKKEAAEMSDSEAHMLIFRAGFSTAQKVSQVSGRGVGMDVVKTNITKLNGTISIDTALGRGTRFTLKLPLTLAIIQSLLVKASTETYAIPLHSVIEVVSLSENPVSTIHGREVIRLREQVVPLLRVADMMSVDTVQQSRTEYAVIIGVGHLRLGLVVEKLIGQKEIVIKPLGTYLKKIPGITGSTILGDGRVIMILDVAELVRIENDKVRGMHSSMALLS